MTVDREQIRSIKSVMVNDLLAELEQADARLAKVPALVEALTFITRWCPDDSIASYASDALAVWDAEQPGPDTTPWFAALGGGRA